MPNDTKAAHAVEAASRTLARHEFTEPGDAYDRLSRDANRTNTAGRIAIAAAGYLVGSKQFRGSRAFDNCFENGDGDRVVAALVARAQHEPALHQAIAADFGGAFPAQWIETAARINAPLFADQGTGRRPDNAAQLIALRAAAPLRPPAGRTDDLDGLALFDADRSPRLI